MVYKNGIREYVWMCVVGGAAYGFLMGLFFQDMVAGLVAGVLFGVLFTAAMALFGRGQEKKANEMRWQISLNRRIICDGPANHKDGANAIGGWLFLTEFGLEFFPHKMNVGGQNLAIPAADILRVDTKRNQIIVYTRLGAVITFVVNQAPAWQQHVFAMQRTY